MSVRININIKGANKVVKDLSTFRKELSTNLPVPLDRSALYYLKTIDLNFRNQGKTFGEPWPPLSPATITEKKKLVAQGKARSIFTPLVRTGALKNSFGRVFLATNKVVIYNAQLYSVIHQYGATAKFNKKTVVIPRRVLMKVDDERITQIVTIFSKWISSLVAKNIK